MAYQVLARKWRPQRFGEVVGQRAVTQTLQNAIATNRIAQAFVFAGPRGVGKTTTARILARALNCVQGPTPNPCGECDACVEIAEGRDMDVLEIDAATHTGIDNVRAVIVEGLSIPPVRDRYKLFIIDEVHQLSTHSFNALLKSIEEPPPHAAFVMATTELAKVPETILSRSQVFEFRTISSNAIATQLRSISDAEGMKVSDEALALVARAADGSMRDAETALDQVRAFAGDTITIEDVSSVLGLVGRDLLLDVMEAVADENGVAAFALAARAVEAGYDLKLVCRELARIVRDVMVLSIDPSRLQDPEVAPEGERDRLQALVARFSREDLLRAFDVLARAEADIRTATEPRYHLEMALLRWIHLRKLMPLAEVIEKLQAESGGSRPGPAAPRSSTPPPARGGTTGPPRGTPPRTTQGAGAAQPSGAATRPPGVGEVSGAVNKPPAPEQGPGPAKTPAGVQPGSVKEKLLAAIEQSRAVFYRTVVAQAKRIEVTDSKVLFTFSPVHRQLKEQVAQNAAWLASLAEQACHQRLAIETELVAGDNGEAARKATEAAGPQSAGQPRRELRDVALGDVNVQSLLGAFPAEIRIVEEIP